MWFQSRLTLNIDMFYQKTTDLLFKKPVNATTGYTTLQSNIGSLENKGLELTLNGKIFTGKFKWDLGGNISFVKNKLLSLIEGNDMYIVPSSGSNLLGHVTGTDSFCIQFRRHFVVTLVDTFHL